MQPAELITLTSMTGARWDDGGNGTQGAGGTWGEAQNFLCTQVILAGPITRKIFFFLFLFIVSM